MHQVASIEDELEGIVNHVQEKHETTREEITFLKLLCSMTLL